MTDAERLSKTAHLTLSSSNVHINIIKSENIKNMDNIKLEVNIKSRNKSFYLRFIPIFSI